MSAVHAFTLHAALARSARARLIVVTLLAITLLAVDWRLDAAESAVPVRLDPAWSSHSVLAVRRMAVLSSEIDNVVSAIHFEMGQSFREGEILATFDDQLPRANVVSAEAAVDAAVASFTALDGLFDRNSASLVEREKARSDMERARASLAARRYELDACAIVAPFSGRVAEVYVNAHELVTRGTKIMAIVDDSRLLAKFLLPETDFGKIGLGDVVTLEIPVIKARRSAVVTHISAVMDPASRTFDVWAGVDNEDAMLRAGMIAGFVGTDGAPE